MIGPPLSGLVLEVPEAEAAVRRNRQRLDLAAPLDVPAHITVLFPFMAPADIDDDVRARLRDLWRAQPAFDFRLTHTRWFGVEVLWLAPEDDEPFRALTRAAHAAFPDYPPYGGEFPEPIPHLTIGDHGPFPQMRAAAEAVRADLPIEGRAHEVTLMVQPEDEEQWVRDETFALGSRDGAPPH